MNPALKIEVLPASCGDCLLVSCPVRERMWHLLVDTGPDKTWPVLRQRLTALPVTPAGRRIIDLAIVSHIDNDHIGGARSLFSDDTLGLSFGDVWFNARHHLVRGVSEGEALTELLGNAARRFPWNAAFDGGPASTGNAVFLQIPAAPEHPEITLLSPSSKRLERLREVWDTELLRLQRGQSNTESEGDRGGELGDLESLAAGKTTRDSKPSNGSSIAVLIEHRGASILLAADAFPTVLGTAILGIAKQRDLALPMRVDAFKLSHHGSRSNLMPELLAAIQAQHYIASTDNSYGHPSDQTLARIVLHGGKTPTICFNYATDQNLRWSDAGLQKRYKFRTRFPSGSGGLVLALPASSRDTVRAGKS